MARRKFKASKPRVIYRRADNGRICTAAYARQHPKTTVKEHRK
jgi:hypothetical protein